PNKIKHQLRRESSANYSGKVNEKSIPTIKDRDYIIVNKPLDGDAPKAFIKIIDDLCSPQREELVLEMIKKEFSDFFVLKRYELIKRIIKTRFSILREEV